MITQQLAIPAHTQTLPAGDWFHYWSNEKQETWKPAPAGALDQLVQSENPRYISILATTVTDDPASRVSAQYQGPLVIDVDRKDEQGGKAAAILDVQNILRKLQALGVNPDQVQWFASGQKGFHIILASALLKSAEFTEAERAHLPDIYKEMVLSIELFTDGNDMSLYSAGRGKMLRQPNIERENGRFKVPLTTAEVLSMTPVLYDTLTAAPREIESIETPTYCPKLGELFEKAAKTIGKRPPRRPKVTPLTEEEFQDLPRSKLVIEIVKREALRRIEELLLVWLPSGEWQGDHYVVRNPNRNDRNPGSFMVWVDGGFKDWACPDECCGGDLVALYAYLNGWGNRMEDAAHKLAGDLGLSLDTEVANFRQSAPAVAPQSEANREASDRDIIPVKHIPRGPAISNIQSLLAKEFPPLKWVVQDVLPAGVTLFAAAPKTGKSWLALDVAVCVAAGVPTLGDRKTNKGRVLYLALEDNERRLNERVSAVMSARGVITDAFDYATEWERIDMGGVERIVGWLQEHSDSALVVVDTLAKIKPDLRANKDRYAQEYAAMSQLKALSDQYDVSILVITHTRKQEGADPVDAISGSLGLSGGVDNTWVMKKPRGEHAATFFVIGRDIVEEVNYGLRWDQNRCVWSIDGTAAEVSANTARQAVIAVLRKSKQPLSVEEIATDVSKDRSSTQRLLVSLCESGMIKRTKHGRSYRYIWP